MVKPLHSLEGLVASHRHLCRRAARKFWRAGLERCDLEQVAAIGLIKAVQRFDPAVRTPFEAYAWLVIVGELMHYVRDHERAVRLPRRLHALEPPFVRSQEALVGRLGREPSDKEVASAMGVLPATVVELRRARAAALTLGIEDAGASNLPTAEDLCVEDRLLVRSSFAALPETERRIIAGLYVLGLTQLDVARRLEISPRRVSRLHRAALAKMQRAWAS